MAISSPRRQRLSSTRHSGEWNNTTRRDTRKTARSVADWGLVATIVVVPFVMGGRQPIGLLTFGLLACFSFIAWSIESAREKDAPWQSSVLTIPMLLGIGWISLQIVPLPASVIDLLAPQHPTLMPLWFSEAETGLPFAGWPYISLNPWQTQVTLTSIVAMAMFCFTIVQRIRTRRDAEFFAKAVGLACGLTAVFAIVQLATTNGKYYWVIDHPYSTTNIVAKGAFVNRNHFAHFMAIGVGPLLWWATAPPVTHNHKSAAPNQMERALVIALLVCVALGGLLSQSRGGIIGMTASGLVTSVLLYRAGRLQGTILVGLAGAALAVGGALAAFDDAAVQGRLETLLNGDLEELDRGAGRREIWQANLRGIPKHVLSGTGLGTHRFTHYPYIENPPDDREYSHAENGYLQVALETGGFGLALVGLLFALALYWCWRGQGSGVAPEVAALAAAATGPLVANLVHSCTDFIWYCPGCMISIVALGAMAGRVVQIERSTPAAPSAAPRWRLGMCTATGIAVTGWIGLTLLPEAQAHPIIHACLRQSLIDEERGNAGDGGIRYQDKLAIRAMQANPFDSRLQAKAAQVYLSAANAIQMQDEMAMPIAQVREAVAMSDFESDQQRQEWLAKVLGGSVKYIQKAHEHAVKAVQLCPLQADAYLTLAETSFLFGATAETEEALFAQAMTARPRDSRVLLAAGRRRLLAGDLDGALELWGHAFSRSSQSREKIIDLLAPFVEPAFLIERFDPDYDALDYMAATYQANGHGQHWATSLAAFLDRVEPAAETMSTKMAARLYIRAHHAALDLDDGETARRMIHLAIKANPSSISARRMLGMQYYREENYTEAAEHLVWCARRQPDDEQLQAIAAQATKESLRADLSTDSVRR